MHVERNAERSRASMASRWTYKARRDGACREGLDRHGDKTRKKNNTGASRASP